MEYKVERNYYRFQINREMKDYLLNFADSRGFSKEDYDTFQEVFTRDYHPKFGTFRIATKGVITYIFCNRCFLVNFADKFKAPWKVYMKGGKWVIFEYYRTEPNDTADTNDSHVTGQSAWRIVTNQIKKNYTEEEIINTLKDKQEQFEPYIIKTSIYQSGSFKYSDSSNRIFCYDNCHYYDLNKAYASATIEAFPKLEPWVLKQYKKNKAKMKQTMNYFVGMMVNKGDFLQEDIFPFFRNYIVKTITQTLEEAIEKTTVAENMNFLDTKVLYANTDGFIVHNPVAKLETSQTELGKFKEEQIDDGKVWFFRHQGLTDDDVSYSIFQYFENGKKIIKCIGGFRTDDELLEQTDLSIGHVPFFGFKEVAGIKEINKEGLEWADLRVE